ncbi:Hypothetical predicted protein [Scomber scombrus]|uniref:Uncharacterized protein n=1 Tax=Scomber scombrus TaxID=13677 RepID=A0AAV1NEV1_SCOSC
MQPYRQPRMGPDSGLSRPLLLSSALGLIAHSQLAFTPDGATLPGPGPAVLGPPLIGQPTCSPAARDMIDKCTVGYDNTRGKRGIEKTSGETGSLHQHDAPGLPKQPAQKDLLD